MSHPAESPAEEFATVVCKRVDVRGPVHPLATPIYTTSTYVLASAHHGALLCDKQDDKLTPELSPYLYSRWSNPTNDVVERIITQLEGGYATHITASGMAAVTTSLFTFLKSGDHVVAPAAIYGGTYELLANTLTKYGIETTFVDQTNFENIEGALRPNTRVVYAETPANPTMALSDLKKLGALGKSKNIVTIVDNTFASPYHQNPISDHGIDVVVHSATKYMGGHSDIIAGSITSATEEMHGKLWGGMKIFGGTADPHVAFLLQRGIKTLDVRMERSSRNALQIAQFLAAHPKIECVHYPGLPTHPQHTLARAQMKRGFGSMLSFEVRGGIEAGKKLVESVRVITLAVSLGGVESLIEHAASMTHTMVPKAERERGGVTDGLIRLSVGIEGAGDLITDLDNALKKI